MTDKIINNPDLPVIVLSLFINFWVLACLCALEQYKKNKL